MIRLFVRRREVMGTWSHTTVGTPPTMTDGEFAKAVAWVQEHFAWQLDTTVYGPWKMPEDADVSEALRDFYRRGRPSVAEQMDARSRVVCVAADLRDGRMDIEEVIEKAKTSRVHWDGLALLSQWHLVNPAKFGPLRPRLSAWVARVLGDMMLNPKLVRPSPRGAPRKSGRNGVIVGAITWVIRQFDLPAERRNREGPRQCCAEGGSACDVVGKALTDVTYGQVRRIWENRQQ